MCCDGLRATARETMPEMASGASRARSLPPPAWQSVVTGAFMVPAEGAENGFDLQPGFVEQPVERAKVKAPVSPQGEVGQP